VVIVMFCILQTLYIWRW